MFRYQFTSTIKDLLDAEDADMTERRGVRKPLRWAIAAIAAMPIIAALSSLGSSHFEWRILIGLLIACGVIYHYIGGSCMRRLRIRRQNAPSMEVSVEFLDDCINVDAADYGAYRREWYELSFINAARGVLLYFTDGTINWLPNRVFKDKMQKHALVEFLQNHQCFKPDTYDIDDD